MKIGNKVIDKLSGPVSIRILTPTEEFTQTEYNTSIIVLLGDEHFNKEHQCYNCDEYNEKNRCCYTGASHYKSYTDDFLKLLDNFNDNIDFYLEGFHSEIISNTKNEYKERKGKLNKCLDLKSFDINFNDICEKYNIKFKNI